MSFGYGFGFGLRSHSRRPKQADGPSLRKYLFLDAACLRYKLDRFKSRYGFEDADLQIDWTRLSHPFNKVFYYDALPGRRKTEPSQDFDRRFAEADRQHQIVQTVDKFRVYQGDARWRSGRGNEQKKVDVMIAVDMLKHTIRRNMDEAALLASDVDFRPLLDALVDEGMFVTLYYPRENTSEELLQAADARTPLSFTQIWDWLDQPSKDRIGYVSSANGSNKHLGELIESWVDSKHGLIEIRRRIENEGGYPGAEYWLQWTISENYVYHLQGTSPNLLKLVAIDDHGMDIPQT